MQIRLGIPILILIILLLIPFHRVLTGHAYLTGTDSFLPYVEPYASKFPDARTGPGTFACRRDGLLQTIPSKYFTQQQLRAGRLPLWNPYIFCGTPHQADMYSQLFALTDTPFLFFLSVDAALTAATLLKLLLLGIGIYLVARRFNIRWEFACISAIIMVFNFQQMQWLEIPAFLSTSLYLPWMFLAWDKFLTTKRLSWIFVTALLGGLSGLGGQGQIYATIWIILLIYSLSRAGQNIIVKRLIRTIALIITFILACAVAWVQFYPAMEFVLLSKGDDTAVSTANLFISSIKSLIHGGWMQIPINILRLFAPYSYQEVDLSYYSIYKELVVYLGLLSPAILLALWRRKRPPFINYLWWVCVISLLLIIFNTVSETIFGTVPFTRFQNLRRMLALVFNFNIALLIPLALQTAIQNADVKFIFRTKIIIISSIIILAGYLYYILYRFNSLNEYIDQVVCIMYFYLFAIYVSAVYLWLFRIKVLNRNTTPVFILILFFLEVWNYSSHLILISDISSTQLTQVKAGLKCEKNRESGRIFREGPYGPKGTDVEDHKRIYWPNTATLAGLYDAQGYNPLNIASYRKLLVSSGLLEPGNPREIPDNLFFAGDPYGRFEGFLWQLLNVNWMLQLKPQLPLYARGELHVDESTITYYHSNLESPNGWARIYFAAENITEHSLYPKLGYLYIWRGEADTMAYITKSEAHLPELAAAPFPTTDSFENISREPGRIGITTKPLEHPAILLVSENNYPGWQVEVDGQPAELLTVDGTFLGVQLDAGSHKVEFTFDPPRFKIGLVVSIISLAALILGFAIAALLESRLTKPKETRKSV